MKKYLYILIILLSFSMISIKVNASSGRLKKNSIITCNGITYGQHSSDNHWHIASKNSDGSYNAVGSAFYTHPCQTNNNQSNNTTKKEEDVIVDNNDDESEEDVIIKTKSSDNTLKQIIIDGKSITISDNMNYSTTKDKVNISVNTADEKATYKISNTDLKLGLNTITIEVTAEDNSIKTYTINVTRERILSSNKDIKLIINDKEIVFNNYKSTIYIDEIDNLNFEYTLSDPNTKIEMNKIDKLKYGNNIINLKVIAEDKSEENYEINLYKNHKDEELINDKDDYMSSDIISVGFFTAILYLFKKK